MPLNPIYIKSDLRSPAQQGLAEDDRFFRDHPDRDYRIREPVSMADRSRRPDGTIHEGSISEHDQEFMSLGDHDVSRRRIIVKRVEPSKARQFGVKYMPIPFLLFADETIEDDDKVLRPIFNGIMRGAADSQSWLS